MNQISMRGRSPEKTGGPQGLSNPAVRKIFTPATWMLYLTIVCEILFMISPFGLYFYSVFGPALNLLRRSSRTAWLTSFFLPHFSETASLLLNAVPVLATVLILLGAGLFLTGAIPIYWSKLRGSGPVNRGPYRFIRHPQYVGLSTLGLGTVLLWPRFLTLVAWVAMLFLYDWLARSEEERCLRNFGSSYGMYQENTGMYLPSAVAAMLPSFLPESSTKRTVAMFGLCVVATVLGLLGAFQLRDYSLSQISAVYLADTAVLSPARLTHEELNRAYRAAEHPTVLAALPADATRLIVHVVPQSWGLPDLAIEAKPKTSKSGGHYKPANFDRRYYKLLFVAPKMSDPSATGRDIVKKAYGGEPIIVANVDVEANAVIGVETPPRHVYWGDIPTPFF